MRTVDIERTAYPNLLGNITDKEVTSRYTLSYEELELVKSYRGNQLSLAVRLKLFEHSLSHNFPLSEVPQEVLDYVASQLQVLPERLSERKDSRSDQIQLIRQYTGFSPFTSEEADKLKAWLQIEAEKQFHLVDLVNEAIFHLSEISVELPAFGRLVRLAAEASYEADRKQRELLYLRLSTEQKKKLDDLLQSERYQRTPFYELKEPPENPNAKTIIREIQLLQRLRSFDISFDTLEQLNNDKIKHFFEIAKSYKSNELYDLNPKIRYPILLCFIYMRIKEVTDNIIELLIRLWKQITKDAEKAQTRIEELTDKITARLKPVSIIDILVDVDKLTGFLDLFETVGYRERMTKEQKARRMVATLLCYGCNLGPTQTQRSTGVSVASILYMRRRYCSEESLLKIVGYLADCQHKTWLASSYGDGTGFITDGTMYSAPKKSMHTEHHFRYPKGRGIISYPLISDQYVALITQAITCSQYEAIAMFEALFQQKSNLPLLKNFSDSHGQSLLTFAFSKLLHIDLLPRLRTRKHKMLYKASKEADYENLNDAIHGVIRWEYARKFYDDMLRILASFYERKASPAHVLLKIAALRNSNSLKIASLEIGKACRTNFLLRISIDMDLRREIQREFLKVERWHKFGKNIFIGHGGKLQEDSLEEQYKTLLMLNVVLNCIVFWNTLAIQQITEELRAEGEKISEEELRHITPTMINHIDLIGKFEINFSRIVPFKFDLKEGEKWQT